MIPRLAAALSLLLLTIAPCALAADRDGDALTKTPKVIAGPALPLDGDTLLIGDVKIRLWGIDAPEMSNWPWGAFARAELDIWTRASTITCEARGRSHDRVVARCTTRIQGHDGPEIDLGEKLIRSGLAVEHRSFSRGAYRTAEDFARTNRMGLWASRP